MSSAKTTIPTVECKVIGNIDWDGFINNFMKEIHIIEIKPKSFIVGPDRKSGTGGVWAGTGSGPVPVDLAGTRPVPRFLFMLD